MAKRHAHSAWHSFQRREEKLVSTIDKRTKSGKNSPLAEEGGRLVAEGNVIERLGNGVIRVRSVEV